MIASECGHCRKKLAFSDDKIGMAVNCPHCSNPVQLPEAAVPTDSGNPIPTAELTADTHSNSESAPTDPAAGIPAAGIPAAGIPVATSVPAQTAGQNQPAPLQPVPAQAIPAKDVPPQAVPLQAIPVQAVPVQAIPVQAIPAQAMPVQAIPAEAVPAQAVPVQAIPAQDLPAQVNPTQPVPALNTPGQPISQPVTAVPTEAVPTEAVPVSPVPAPSVPTETEPSPNPVGTSQPQGISGTDQPISESGPSAAVNQTPTIQTQPAPRLATRTPDGKPLRQKVYGEKTRPVSRRPLSPALKYGLLYGGSATAVLIVVIVVLLMIQKSISGGPVRVFEQYQQAVNDQDFGRIYDLVDDDTRHTLDLHAAEQAENFGFRSQLKGREKFIEISKYSLENSESIRVKLKEKSDATVNAKIRNQTLNGQTATLTVEFPDGKTEFIEVQKIDGQWRLGFSSVSRLFVIF